MTETRSEIIARLRQAAEDAIAKSEARWKAEEALGSGVGPCVKVLVDPYDLLEILTPVEEPRA